MTHGQTGDAGSLATGGRLANPTDLGGWLKDRSPGVAELWTERLLTGGSSWTRALEPMARSFCRGLVSFLPGMLGPYRAQVLPLWSECAELFGSVAARRGLSAGDVIEEFHILREVVIRMMFDRPPAGLEDGLLLREVLQLNRAVDIGVTQASVGHTDLLFFSLVHGSGVPEPLSRGDVDQVCEQVRTMQEEGGRIMRHLERVGRR
ncbi:MAG: hypothetical protein OXE96_09245 [Gemmatimonadetes bacterium]|nr:hypothetical protein [Gemmatimonadota bacterium]